MPYQLSSVEFGQSAQTFSNLRECDMTRRPFFSMQIFLLPNNWCSITRFFYTEGSTWFHMVPHIWHISRLLHWIPHVCWLFLRFSTGSFGTSNDSRRPFTWFCTSSWASSTRVAMENCFCWGKSCTKRLMKIVGLSLGWSKKSSIDGLSPA